MDMTSLDLLTTMLTRRSSLIKYKDSCYLSGQWGNSQRQHRARGLMLWAKVDERAPCAVCTGTFPTLDRTNCAYLGAESRYLHTVAHLPLVERIQDDDDDLVMA